MAELPSPAQSAPDSNTTLDNGTAPNSIDAQSPQASASPEKSDVQASSDETAPKASQQQYYLVTNYVDEASLGTIKATVPDAKVVTFTEGKKIQLQQLSDETAARAAKADLEQKGLSVEILVSTE